MSAGTYKKINEYEGSGEKRKAEMSRRRSSACFGDAAVHPSAKRIGKKPFGARIVALLLAFALCFPVLSGGFSPLFAVVIGNLANGDAIELDEVRFILNHKGFDFSDGYFEFQGKNLKDIPVYMRLSGAAQPIGRRTVNENELVIVTLTQEEIQNFSGELIVGGKNIALNISNFPNLQSANKGSVVENATPNDVIKFIGSNLGGIGSGGVVAEYGAGTNFANLIGAGSTVSADGKTITFTNPQAPGRKGYQDIKIYRFSSATSALPAVKVEYQYIDAFRILEKMDTGAVTMFPNTGSKGDEVYIESKNLNASNTYEVYFLKTMDGSDRPSAVNRAQHVSLGVNINGTDDDKLTVKVPNHVNFEAGTYYVLLTKIQNGQIIAEDFVKTAGGDVDTYAVIQAGFSPKIISVHPPKGPDTGSNVEVKAHYVISLNIPDLTSSGNIQGGASMTGAVLSDADTVLTLNYEDGTYKGEDVTIARKINMTIGQKALFTKKNIGTETVPEYVVDIVKGTQDKLMMKTQPVADAETNPKRDVIIEMETVLTVKDGDANPNNDKKYTFRQVVRLANGYEFEPSSYTPVIDSITPNVIHVEQSGAFFKMKDEILISVKGENFFVDRLYRADGTLAINQPSLFIKKNGDNTQETNYQFALLPNAETVFNGQTYRGLVYHKNTESGTPILLTAADGKPVMFEMQVLDKDGRVVDGTEGNRLGSNIIVKIPANALIKDIGSKHLLVTNPTRASMDYGHSSMEMDVLTFITTTDAPVIEKVEPAIVTVDGGDDIVITGSNIAPGAKLYIDGNEITGFTAELNPTGDKTLVKFKAPEGREGLTQLLLQNPSGGIAVADFTFVNSFDKDPVFDSFAPPSGTYGTIVVARGDNFLKPDPTAVTERGIDAYRLVGTRMFIDGREVDSFKKDASGRIVFAPYTVPNAEQLIKADAGLAVYSKLAENSTVTYTDGAFNRVAQLGKDAGGNPMIVAGDEAYSIIWNSSSNSFSARTKAGKDAGAATVTFAADPDPKKGTTTIAIAGAADVPAVTFTAAQDNYVFRIGRGADGEERAYLSNYADSVTYKGAGEPPVRYTLTYSFNGEPTLTNGKDKTYTLKVVNVGGVFEIKAVNAAGDQVPVTATATGITIDGVPYTMITPYETDASGIIVGHLSKVVSRTDIVFEVPVLSSGRGFKDLVIVNPDTKSVGKLGNEGFFYVPQASTKPVLSTVSPGKGSVDGGYYVTLTGSDFADDARVFVDGVEVPEDDTYVALNGKSIVIKMVKTDKKLAHDYGVDQLSVPVVVLNPDGGAAGRKDAFTYIIPKSSPIISRIVPEEGSSNGGEIVEIIGTEFRFFEPYTNIVGDPGYQSGDKHEDIFPNAKWDSLLDSDVLIGLEKLKTFMLEGRVTDPEYLNLMRTSPILPVRIHGNPFYDFYYLSKVLPKVYFGENEARIVEFANGFIKVLTPSHAEGAVDVYVINNDSGVSNKYKYSYKATAPVIRQLIPDIGARGGSEPKEIFGEKLFGSTFYGYVDAANTVVAPVERISGVDAVVRFGSIDNTKVPRIEQNSGLINNQRTTVSLEGGLTLQYYGDQNKIRLTINERNTVFNREFEYDPATLPDAADAVYIPIGMLRDAGGVYYVPTALLENTEYTQNPNDYKQPYEYIKVYISDRRMFVERGYAPKVVRENENHVTVYTPAYYTIGKVDMKYVNPDGGSAIKAFEYTNPASKPKILKIEPQTLNYDEKMWLVESSVLGGIDIEIIGTDMREGLSVTIGDKKATVKELTTKVVGGTTYDLAIVTVPVGTNDEIGRNYPIIITNTDKGIATSNNIKDLIGPNHGTKTIPYYFVYRKPLSFPTIKEVFPRFTSIAGGNKMVVEGSDFRTGAYVIIGTRAGIPIYSGIISDQGKKITFNTPTNMTLGKKDVQVLNTDYGTGIIKDGITVVSAPKIESGIYQDGGGHMNRLSVEGGQTIILKGSGFQQGAKVFFGGVWTEVENQNPSKEPGTNEGLYIDDTLYYVKDGLQAPSVEFIDDQTLKVTTPAFKKEVPVSVVVLNADGGITNDYTSIDVRVPIPDDPYGLKVTTVDNRYIKLYDYKAENAKYFEIYTYIGKLSNTKLRNNNYQDFKYLGVTEVEPHKIIELPGFDNMKATERIVFVLRAVNKYGQSGFSNFAALHWNNVKAIKELGPQDIDGDLGVKDKRGYEIQTVNGGLEIEFGEKVKVNENKIDAFDKNFQNTGFRKISFPAKLIIGRSKVSAEADFGATRLKVTAASLNTREFKGINGTYKNVYGSVVEDSGINAPTPALRGRKAVTPVYRVGFEVSSDARSQTVSTLAEQFEYSIKVPARALKDASKIEMYRYDERSGRYVKVDAVYDSNTSFMTTKSLTGGYFLLMEVLD